MKQFIVTVPNPYKGEGSRGVSSRVAPVGMPTVSTWIVYVNGRTNTEANAVAREKFREHLGTAYVPDGADIRYVCDEPRASEGVVEITNFLMETISFRNEDAKLTKAIKFLRSNGVQVEANDEGDVFASFPNTPLAVRLNEDQVNVFALSYDIAVENATRETVGG